MKIGDRICLFRNLRGMSQKELGLLVGFSETSAETRVAQYEVGKRKPKAELAEAFAKALKVSPFALRIPDIKSPLLLMHILFALEDDYGMWIEMNNKAVALNFDPYNHDDAARLFEMLCAWRDVFEKRINGKFSKEEYDNWRYNYLDTGGYVK